MGIKIFWSMKFTKIFSALSEKAGRTVIGRGIPYYSVTHLEPGEEQESLNSESGHF